MNPYTPADLERVTADRVRAGDVLATATGTPGRFGGRTVIEQPRRDLERGDVYKIRCRDITYWQPIGLPLWRVRAPGRAD